MAAFTSQFLVTVWTFLGLFLCSNARVLSKPCIRSEFIAVVNSSHLFGLPVECHDVCEVLAASRDSVAACSEGIHERNGWTLCESSTPLALVLQDSNNKHLCIVLTTRQQSKHIHSNSCAGIIVNINGCYHLKEDGSRHRRNAEITEAEGSTNSQHVHSWAIVVSSAVTTILLVLILVLCVGGNKTAPATSSSSKVPVHVAQEDSTQNATIVSQTTNHLDSANQTTVSDQNQAVTADKNQHLYQNVNIQVEGANRNGGLPILSDQNQDQQPPNQNQEQMVVELIANQNEPIVDQNEESQAAAADPNQAQIIVQDHRPEQAADQDQVLQEAANDGADQQQDPEKARVLPYGVVTIHSDQSNTIDNNYAEVRNEEDENIQDITYDRVNDNTEVTENGYSTVVRDKPTQQQPQRDRMYESVDEAFDRGKNSEPVVNGGEEGLEQDDMYEKVPDEFRQKVTSLSQQAEAPKLPPMHSRSRKPSDDPAIQHRASSTATLPSANAPSSPLMRSRLYSSPVIKSSTSKAPPSFPAPAVPPPSIPAPNPPTEYDDDDDSNALYARPEPTNMQSRDKAVPEEARMKSVTLPLKGSLSYAGAPRSPVALGPLPEVPMLLSNQPEREEEEENEPGYDTTESVKPHFDYDHLESDKTQEEEQGVPQEHHEASSSSPKTPSSVKHDAKGYALPSTKKSNEESYAVVNITHKRMSQKKKDMGGTKNDPNAARSQSPLPPSPPPSIDPALLDEEDKHEPSVPPRLPQSEELVEPDKVEPPYAKVNKIRASQCEMPSAMAETGDDGNEEEIDPYAAVDIIVLTNGSEMQATTSTTREYDTIENVMSPPADHNPVNVTLSELEGDYACVRSDATITPASRPHLETAAVSTTNDGQTPASAVAHEETSSDENTATRSITEYTQL